MRSNTTGKKTLAISISALVMAGLSITTTAEEDFFILEEIIITAQKRVESLQDVPISVNTIGGKKLNQIALGSLEDVQTYVPNLHIAQAPVMGQIFIRGIGSGLNQGFEQSVGMYMDGIHYGRSQQARNPFMDLERVEVLRGPQSILFGKNSIAGAISMISAKPTKEFEASLAGLYEPDHGEKEVTLIVSGPITDRLRGRLAVRDRSMDGYMENLTLDRDEAALDQFMVRATMIWEPTDDTQISLKLETSEYDSDGRAIEVTEDTTYATMLHGTFNQHESVLNIKQDYKRSGNGDHSYNDTDNVTLTIAHEINAGTITSITGYSGYEYDEFCDCDFTGAPTLDTDWYEDYDQLSQELRFTSPKGETLDYITGIFYQRGEIDFADRMGFGPNSILPAAMSAGPAGAMALFMQNTAAARDYQQETKGWSLFAQATWNVSKKLHFNFGGRYSQETKEATRFLRFIDLATGEVPTDAPQAAALPILYSNLNFLPHDLDEDRKETSFTPSLTLEYDYDEDTMMYITASTGFKSGGFDTRDNSGLNFEFEEEEAETLEVGAKMSLGSRAELNIAVFYTEFSDLQVSVYDGVMGFKVGNAAQAVSQGIELDGRWRVSEGLTLTGAMGYLDFEFGDYANGQCPEGVSADSVVDGVGYCDYSGQRNMYSPELTATITADHVVSVSENLELRTSVDLIYSDEYFVAPDMDPDLVQDSYTKVNFRIALGDIDKRWEVALVGRNLTDEAIMTFGTDTSMSGTVFHRPSNFAMMDRPRSVAIQANYNF